ncbi:hypothetical protein SAMN05421805_1329 [Saccharopolyspora antimicrobica]|uniref:GAF domain-containing protein n=1 Tax=Saccharopolyspora antimicrobica TaxID=455193 RepID=A0A1I5LPV5_9PSEU|nr:GAF domain-containing protein [Saccharopolyspora antimicrobica]RKT87848.1 GAF domain-containing protein [Saccharopolyspora antimicrobica]SFO98801.1 hypothetical protein SAMN05421805_1329 [Saccharopolyspora antimicrobica]
MDETTRRLAAARENALSGGTSARVRPEVRASWDRARKRGVHPDRSLAPVEPTADLVGELTRKHRLADVWPTLLRTIGDAATQPGHLVFISDPAGRLLRVVGDPATRRNAERARLVPGALWNEEQVGTSGVGTALALGRPFQVRGPEHYLSVAADFNCSAAPIVDPVTGETVGTIDVTYPVASANALAMPLVAAAARLAGAQLGEQTRQRDDEVRARYVDNVLRRSGIRSALVGVDGRMLHTTPAGWLLPQWAAGLGEDGPMTLPDGQRVVVERLSPSGPFAVHGVDHPDRDGELLRVQALGRGRALVHVDGMPHELSLRHSELVVLLAAHPGGMSAEEMARQAYGPNGKAVTVRAEMTRLRRVLGYRLRSDPYRLAGRVSADFLELERSLAERTGGEALDCYPAPLLPASRAAGIEVLRDGLHLRVRRRLISHGDADAIARWIASPHGRDDVFVRRMAAAPDEHASPGE